MHSGLIQRRTFDGLDRPCAQVLTDTELDSVSAGTVQLVHEKPHAGTTSPPRTGGGGPAQPSRPSAPPTRSPPTGFA